jgi:hypothetical protein
MYAAGKGDRMADRAQVWAVFALSLAVSGTAVAADQPVGGLTFSVKDPRPGVDVNKRALSGHARQAAGPAVVGDPRVGGATITFFARGSAWTSQAFSLPAGTNPLTGKPFWRSTATGYAYSDGQGANGPVRSAKVQSSGGTFDLRASAVGKLGPISLLPPNPGSAGCVRFDIGGGDSYHALLDTPGATIVHDTDRAFVLRNATATGLCPTITTSTVTTTTTSTSTVSTTTSSTSTSLPTVCCQDFEYAPGATLILPCGNSAGMTVEYCQERNGTPVAAAVCDGSGRCVPPPGSPGYCCQAGSGCAALIDQTSCVFAFHGNWSPSAVCMPDGSCQ